MFQEPKCHFEEYSTREKLFDSARNLPRVEKFHFSSLASRHIYFKSGRRKWEMKAADDIFSNNGDRINWYE